MTNFPTAAQARERGQGNRVITEEIMLLEITVLDAIAAGLLTKDFGGVSYFKRIIDSLAL